MKFRRRQFLHLAAGAAALSTAPHLARAQSYPAKPERWIVGFAPAGGNDIVARLMGQWLTERLGQSFVIENRPGAATNLAAEATINAAPDGYTLFLANVSNAINATFYTKLNFNFIRDTTPVAAIMRMPNVMLVNPSVPAKTVPEFISYAKGNPGKINMASAGIGSGGHLAGELFKMMTGVNMIHVPFRGNGPALTALLGGQVEVQFATLASSVEFIRTGKLRALGITTAKRSDALSDLPAIDESVKGYEESSWYGIAAPKGVPVNVVQILNKEINAALVDSKIKAQIANLGGIEMPGTPDDFGKLIVEETDKWAKVIRAANIKAD
jgi:tripartite-type tricarboxylate transporter receptor subunit TctC